MQHESSIVQSIQRVNEYNMNTTCQGRSNIFGRFHILLLGSFYQGFVDIGYDELSFRSLSGREKVLKGKREEEGKMSKQKNPSPHSKWMFKPWPPSTDYILILGSPKEFFS